MKTWLFAVLSLACLAAAGCRTDPAVAMLERENRQLEYRLYELADLLRDCRRDNARLQRRYETRPSSGSPAFEMGRDAPSRRSDAYDDSAESPYRTEAIDIFDRVIFEDEPLHRVTSAIAQRIDGILAGPGAR